jgi:hypothetical protein
MCIYTIFIHTLYLVSDLEGSDNGNPLYGRSVHPVVQNIFKYRTTGTEL